MTFTNHTSSSQASVSFPEHFLSVAGCSTTWSIYTTNTDPTTEFPLFLNYITWTFVNFVYLQVERTPPSSALSILQTLTSPQCFLSLFFLSLSRSQTSVLDYPRSIETYLLHDHNHRSPSRAPVASFTPTGPSLSLKHFLLRTYLRARDIL